MGDPLTELLVCLRFRPGSGPLMLAAQLSHDTFAKAKGCPLELSQTGFGDPSVKLLQKRQQSYFRQSKKWRID